MYRSLDDVTEEEEDAITVAYFALPNRFKKIFIKSWRNEDAIWKIITNSLERRNLKVIRSTAKEYTT